MYVSCFFLYLNILRNLKRDLTVNKNLAYIVNEVGYISTFKLMGQFTLIGWIIDSAIKNLKLKELKDSIFSIFRKKLEFEKQIVQFFYRLKKKGVRDAFYKYFEIGPYGDKELRNFELAMSELTPTISDIFEANKELIAIVSAIIAFSIVLKYYLNNRGKDEVVSQVEAYIMLDPRLRDYYKNASVDEKKILRSQVLVSMSKLNRGNLYNEQ
jgi:hypothetical protein